MRTGTTAILVTHDLAEAGTVADRIVEISDLSASAPLRIVDLTAADTYDLRWRLLRDGTPSSDVTFAQDDRPGTFHVGARLGGRVVGTSTWAIEPWPDEPGTPAIRIRGMAVDQQLQGTGCGVALVDEGMRRAAALPVALVWATARDTVLGFYERCGFDVVGEGFVDGTTALAHHTVIRRL
jgi:GNAT superfamily N-acetyltransferase